jgi:DUF4097 and DUF4098 domain-containing protein YvlB
MLRTANKTLFTALLLSLASFSGFAADREKVDQTRPVVADGFVSVQVTRGDLHIEGWERSEVQVKGWMDEEAIEFVFEVNGNQTEIAVKIPRHTSGWSARGETDLSIFVPMGSNIDVRGVSTDIGIKKLTAGIKVNSVSGDVQVSQVQEGANLTTISGDIRLNDITGRVHGRSVSGDLVSVDVTGPASYESVSGDIEVKGSGTELIMETVSGELLVSTGEISELSGHTVSGDIEAAATLANGGNIDLRSTSGRIGLNLPVGTSARFDLQSGSGGQIRNRLTDDEPRVSKYSRDSLLRFVMGDGAGEVTMETTSGRIVLAR